jgi:pumilio family protein 6
LALERKAAKPLADEVHRTKKIWEKLRIKSNVPKEERQKLVDELFTIITGRMRDFVLKHDAVRAVQTALKYSTAPRRKQIAKELQGTYAQLAESRYAKFLIGKLLVQGDKEIRDMIIPEFYGKARKLINHPEASWILDDIYRTVATKEQKALLLREWYGPEFTIREMAKAKDENPTADLKQILEDEPNKRGPIMKGLFDMINSLVQKKMTGFTMLHDAMLQYFLSTEPGTDDFNAYTELFKDEDQVDLLKNLAFTRSGSRLMCLLLAHGSAKDRKVLLRAFRDTILIMAGDAYGHIVILTAYDVIDDTKMTSKSIFPELLGEGEETIQQNVIGAANNDHGRLTFLYLLEGLSKSLFPPGRSYALEVLNEVHEIRKTTSKKPNDQRRSELVAALSPQLLSVVAAAPTELTATSHGCQFVADVLLSCVGDKQAPLEAIAGIAAGDPNEETNEEDTAHSSVHISKTAFGSRMLKLLIQGGRFDSEAGKVIPVDPPLNFSNLLYPEIKDHVVDWATGPGSFVIVGLVEANDFNDVDALKKTLKKNKKLLEKAATEMTAEQKQAKETEDQEQKPAKKGKKEKPVGNVGSKILLEAI